MSVDKHTDKTFLDAFNLKSSFFLQSKSVNTVIVLWCCFTCFYVSEVIYEVKKKHEST